MISFADKNVAGSFVGHISFLLVLFKSSCSSRLDCVSQGVFTPVRGLPLPLWLADGIS